MKTVRRALFLSFAVAFLVGWMPGVGWLGNWGIGGLAGARPETLDLQLETFTHTTQADWMAGERDHLDVRTLDALGTPYDFDQDPRGAMRLRSRPGPWRKHPGSPVVEPGPEGTWDDAVISEPKVIYDGETYHLWYAGRRRGPPGLKMPMDLGYATSPDGVHWSKHEANPVLVRGPLGGYDENMITAPSVLYDGKQFYMWFSAVDFRGDWSINHATSSDGARWAKGANPLLEETHDDRWDAVYIAEPSVIFDGSSFKMWYNGASATTETLLGYATSPDGVHWERLDENRPVLDVAPDGAWDDFAVARAHVLYDGEQYKMWYEGHNGSTWRIGYATSPDGIHWERSTGNPIVDLGPEGAWDSVVVSEPYALFDGQTYWLWHSGYDGDRYRTGLVTAPAVYDEQGTFVSPPIESARPIEWGTLTCDLDLPERTQVHFEVATSDDGRVWGEWIDAGTLVATGPFSDGQDIDLYALNLPATRALRYRATLITADPSVSPLIREIAVAEALPDFRMTLPQASVSLRPGEQAGVEVSLEAVQGFAASVRLSVAGLPGHLSATWSPGVITPPGSATLNLEASAIALPGTIPLTLTAASGDLVHKVVLSLSLLEPLPTPTATSTPLPTATPTPLPTRGPTPTPVPPPPPPEIETQPLWWGAGIAVFGGLILLAWGLAFFFTRTTETSDQVRTRWWRHWAWAVLVALVILVGVYPVWQHLGERNQAITEYEGLVADWPSGKDVPPDWLTEGQIRDAIEARIVAPHRRTLTVKYLDQATVLDVADLGFQSNAEELTAQAIAASKTESGQVTLAALLQSGQSQDGQFAFNYTIDNEKLRAFVQDIADKVERPLAGSTIDEQALTFSASRVGVSLDTEQAFDLLEDAIFDLTVTEATLPVTIEEAEPLTDGEIALALSRIAVEWSEPPLPAAMQSITISFDAERWIGGTAKAEDWTPTRPMTGYTFLPGRMGWTLDITAAHQVIREAVETGAQGVSFKVITGVAPAPLTLADIKPALLEVAGHFDGFAGFYVQDLATGEEVRHNTYVTTSGMSMLKVAIMATAYRSITRPFSAALQDAMANMIAHSINEKSNYVILQIGEGDFQEGLGRVNETLQTLGMHQTYIRSAYRTEKGPFYEPIPIPKRPAADVPLEEQVDLWPDTAMQTSLSDQAILFEALYRGTQGTGRLLEAFPHLTPGDCQEMLDLLKTNPTRTFLGPGFSDDVPMAHKNGFGGGQYTDERMNVGIIWPPGGRPYLVGLYQWDKIAWIHWLRVWPQQIEFSTTLYNYFTTPPTLPAPSGPE